MQNYSEDANGSEIEIVRGSRWPPANDQLRIRIVNTTGWPAGAADWAWRVLISRTIQAGPPDLVLAPDSVVLDTNNQYAGGPGNQITLYVHATADQTASLPAISRRRDKFFVDVVSTPGAGGTTTTPAPDDVPERSVYDCVQGWVWVRNRVGQGA